MKTKSFTFIIAILASIEFCYCAILTGTCGPHLTWTVNTQDSTLTIEGYGEMRDFDIDVYNSSTASPWSPYKSYIAHVSLPVGLTYIGAQAFYSNYKITSLEIPQGVQGIGFNAFCGCNKLKSITIPNSIRRIGGHAFYLRSYEYSLFITDLESWCNIEFENEESNPMIHATSVYLCGDMLRELIIPDGIKVIKNYAFNGCSQIRSIIIPNSVESIGNSAFLQCEALTTVTIGSGLNHIGANTFSYCYNLTTIEIIKETPPNDVLNFGVPDSCILYVPQESIGLYSSSLYWESFSEIRPLIGYIKATITSTNDIWGSVEGSSYYKDSSMVTIKATSNYGYHFVQWNDSIIDNPRTILLTHDTTFTAIFVKNIYCLTYNSDSTMGKVNGATEAAYLDSVSFEAISHYGYHFVRWTDGNTQNPRRIIVTKSSTYTAVFAKNTYSVTKRVTPLNCGQISGKSTASYLDKVTLTASANYGYRFIQWSDSVTDISRTFVVTQDTVFTAEFAKNPTIDYKCDKSMGYITGETTLTGVAADSVTFSATANYGYHFVQWSDSVTDNPRTIFLDKDTIFSAEFAPNIYVLHTESSNQTWGTTTGDTIAPFGTRVQVSATPNYGYYFAGWSDGNHQNPRSMYLRGDTTFTAIFEKRDYSISIIADSIMGKVTCVERALHLDTLTVTATSNHGYHFVQWSDSIIDNPRTFVLTRDTTFIAEFAQTFTGQCGDSLYWAFKNDSLAFSGSGNMYSYVPENIPWSLLINQTQYIEFAPEMTSISAFAFQNMENLRKLNLSAKIFTIGDFAFDNCTSLDNVTIPNSVISLGASSFYGCAKIDTLIIGTGVQTITNQFRVCTGLRYVQFGKNIRSIDYGSFYDARLLNYITCYAKLPPLAYPDEVGKERSFYNMNARVQVPCDNFEEYEIDALWGSFNLKCLSSNSGTAVDGQVIVVPGDADATFTWPTDGSADTYNLEITQDSVTFCSLIFDSEGRLLGIAFAAPLRDGIKPHMPTATMTTNGMSFQVTGLDYASQYRFSFETKDDNTQTIFAYTGGFHTNGADAPEGFDDISVEGSALQKVMIDGQIFSLRGEMVYALD